MKTLKNIAISLGLIAGIVGVGLIAVPSTVSASAASEILDGSKTTGQSTGSGGTLTENITRIVNIILFILGAIAVIVIIIGGVRYVVSGGDSGAVKGAKDTILYAVVGLVVALLAYAIVNFVVTQFVKP